MADDAELTGSFQIASIAQHLRRAGDRDEVHLLWKGFTQSLWEWEPITRAVRDRIFYRLKPVGNAEIGDYLVRRPSCDTRPGERDVGKAIWRSLEAHDDSDAIHLIWTGYLAARQIYGEFDGSAIRLRDWLRDDGDEVTVLFVGYLDDEFATAGEYNDRIARQVNRHHGSDIVRLIWDGYLHALHDLGKLSELEPVDWWNLLGPHPLQWNERLICQRHDARGFYRSSTPEELADELARSLSDNGDTDKIHLIWKGYLAARLEWKWLEHEDHRILNAMLRPLGNDEVIELLEDIPPYVDRADIVWRDRVA